MFDSMTNFCIVESSINHWSICNRKQQEKPVRAGPQSPPGTKVACNGARTSPPRPFFPTEFQWGLRVSHEFNLKPFGLSNSTF